MATLIVHGQPVEDWQIDRIVEILQEAGTRYSAACRLGKWAEARRLSEQFAVAWKLIKDNDLPIDNDPYSGPYRTDR